MTEPTLDQTKAFVIAGHGNLAQVQAMLAENPSLLDRAHAWSETDHETAIQAAAHVGARPIAEFLLAQGAPLALPTAAMLGREDAVRALLEADPNRIHEPGAHGIPLLAHAAWSGDAALVAVLHGQGAVEGASTALCQAVMAGHVEVARWLLAHAAPDLTWRNVQGKTAHDLARERADPALIGLFDPGL
jgi:ankyrin repeat protein